jgi:hypothetical protein
MLPEFRSSIAFFGGFQASPVCPSGNSDVYMKISIEHWCDDTDRGTRKYWERSLSQCHFDQYKFHMAGLGQNPGVRDERPATDLHYI